MGQTRNLERNFKYFELIENENTNYQNVSDAVKAVLKGKFVTLEKWTWKSLSRFQFFTTPWNIQCMEFSRPEYWSGKPFLSPGIFPTTQRSNQVSCTAGRFFTSWATREAQECWSGWPIPSLGDLPSPGTEPGSPALQADYLPTELWGKPITLGASTKKDTGSEINNLHFLH